MKSAFSFLALAALLTGFSSCEKVTGEGPLQTEVRAVSGFSGVDARVSADVIVKKDTAYRVEVQAQQNILNVLRTYESGGRLVVRFENDVRVRSHEPIRIVVSTPVLTNLRLSGSGDVRTIGAFQCQSMEMDLSGSGSMEMTELNAASIDANISGSGNIRVLNGIIPVEKLKISGSGGIDLGGVQATHATTRTSGSGDIRVHASQRVEVTISGSGSVFYKGNPQVSSQISGSGRVLPY